MRASAASTAVTLSTEKPAQWDGIGWDWVVVPYCRSMYSALCQAGRQSGGRAWRALVRRKGSVGGPWWVGGGGGGGASDSAGIASLALNARACCAASEGVAQTKTICVALWSATS
jgi:hypothetical protein